MTNWEQLTITNATARSQVLLACEQLLARIDDRWGNSDPRCVGKLYGSSVGDIRMAVGRHGYEMDGQEVRAAYEAAAANYAADVKPRATHAVTLDEQGTVLWGRGGSLSDAYRAKVRGYLAEQADPGAHGANVEIYSHNGITLDSWEAV